MPQEFNQYQLAALQQLADYRGVFTVKENFFTVKTKPVKGSKISMQQFIDSFIEIFCQNNFADADYSLIQNKPLDNPTLQDWINTINVETILQCITYAIWTDKSFDGYFLRKINDGSLSKLLVRLESIISDNYRQLKVQRTKVTVINNALQDLVTKNK